MVFVVITFEIKLTITYLLNDIYVFHFSWFIVCSLGKIAWDEDPSHILN